MDASFLKSSVGDALAQGLTQVAIRQPSDSVAFLGEFLLSYVAAQERAQAADATRRACEEAAAAAEAARAAEAAEADAREAQAAAARQEEEALAGALTHASRPIDECTAAVLASVREYTGASAVYIAQKGYNDAAREDELRYTAATEGNDFMVGRSLLKSQGVTFDAWEKRVDPEADPDDPPPPALPEYIHVANVIREPRMHYFGVPKLGSFLCVPFGYNSVLHDAAVIDEEGKSEEEPSSVPVQMMLALDTMGDSDAALDHDKITYALKWAGRLGEGLEAAERKVLETETLARAAAIESNQEDLIALGQKRTAAERAVAEEVARLATTDASDDDKKFGELQFRLAKAAEAAESVRARVDQMAAYRVQLRPELAKVFEQVLFVLGYRKADFYDSSNKRPEWGRMRLLLADGFYDAVRAYNPEARRKTDKYAKADKLKGKLSGINLEATSAVSAAVGALLSWALVAVETRAFAVGKRNGSEDVNE